MYGLSLLVVFHESVDRGKAGGTCQTSTKWEWNGSHGSRAEIHYLISASLLSLLLFIVTLFLHNKMLLHVSFLFTLFHSSSPSQLPAFQFIVYLCQVLAANDSNWFIPIQDLRTRPNTSSIQIRDGLFDICCYPHFLDYRAFHFRGQNAQPSRSEK